MVTCTDEAELNLRAIATKCALDVIYEDCTPVDKCTRFTRQRRRTNQRKIRKRTKGANEEKKIYDYLYSLYSLYSLNLHNNHLKSIYNYNNYKKLGRMNSTKKIETRKIEMSLAELAQIVLEASKSRVQTDPPQEIEALTVKNEALTAELEAVTAELEARRTTIEALTAELEALRTTIEAQKRTEASPFPELLRVKILNIEEPTKNRDELWRQLIEFVGPNGNMKGTYLLGPTQYMKLNALNNEEHKGWLISFTRNHKGWFQADNRTANPEPPTPTPPPLTLGAHLRHQQLSDDNGFLPLPPDGDTLDNWEEH